jgi:ribosomal protein S18 acetylase RimI-like enzyme
MTFVALTKETISIYIPDMIRISAQLEGDYWTSEHYLSELPGKWKWSYLAMDDQQFAGFMIVSDKGTSHHLHRIVVDKRFQKKNLGKTMLLKLIEDARANGKNMVTLKVHHNNLKATELYKNFGFHIVEKSGENYSMMLTLQK